MSPKVFIVTGASRGIGAAITQRLLSQSHKVVIAARSRELLEAVKQSHPDQVEYVAGDLTDSNITSKIVETAVKAFGRVDGIVINHGVCTPKKLADVSLNDFRHVYEVNVFSYLALAKAALAELRKSKGSIVWISAGTASMTFAAWGAYSSSKAALNAISAHLAVEEPDVISVTIEPGRVDTDMQAVIRSEGKTSMSPALYDNFVEAFEQGDLLRPEVPGNVIAKFVAEPSRELSGKSLSWNSPELASYQQ